MKSGFLPSPFYRVRMSGGEIPPHRHPAVGPCFRRGDESKTHPCVAAGSWPRRNTEREATALRREGMDSRLRGNGVLQGLAVG